MPKQKGEKENFLFKVSRRAYPLFRGVVAKILEKPSMYEYVVTLEKAFPSIPPQFLLSSIFVLSLLSMFLGTFLSISLVFLGAPPIFWGVPALGAAMTAAFVFLYPGMKAKGRSKEMDKELSYAVRFMSVLASSGLTVGEIFARLAELRELYPEISKESSIISYGIKVLGKSPIEVLSEVSERTPNEKFSELLRGIVTTLQSGGDLKAYLLTKTEEFEFLANQKREKEIEGLSFFLEGYIVLAVALPVFLVIMFASMGLTGSGSFNSVGILKMFFFLVLPMAHGAYFYMVYDTFRKL